MKNTLWLIIVIVSGFLGFMVGYSTPPFMEVGFGVGGHGAAVESLSDEEMLKQYEDLYRDDDASGEQ